MNSVDQHHLLTDQQMQQFIRDGYIAVSIDTPLAFHQSIRRQMDDLLEQEPNPGNNLLPRIPDLAHVYADDAVVGALQSILGPGYQMEDHRYPHVNEPGSESKKIHKDGAHRGDHRVRRAFGFYYPQDTPQTLGPTGVLPGSQYFSEQPDIPVLPLVADTGVVIIAHYEIFHLATANQEDRARYMMKFQFTRTDEPEIPSWNLVEPEWTTDSRMHQAIWGWHMGGGSPHAEGLDRDVLTRQLTDPSEAVRNEAAYGLAALAVQDDDIIDELVRVLKGADNMAAQGAVYGLAAIGVAAVDRLLPLLDDTNLDNTNGDIAGFAIHALSEMGTAAEDAQAALRGMLANEDAAIRRRAAEALGNCQGSEPNLTIPALIELLDDPDKSVPRVAAASIDRLAGHPETDASSKVIQDLKRALSNDDRYVRGLAAKALRHLGTPEALGIVIDWLQVSRWCPLTTAKSPF